MRDTQQRDNGVEIGRELQALWRRAVARLRPPRRAGSTRPGGRHRQPKARLWGPPR